MSKVLLPLFCEDAYKIGPNEPIAPLLTAFPAAGLTGMLGQISLLPVVCFNRKHKDLQMRLILNAGPKHRLFSRRHILVLTDV